MHLDNWSQFLWRGENGRGSFFVDKIQIQVAVYHASAEHLRIVLGYSGYGGGGSGGG